MEGTKKKKKRVGLTIFIVILILILLLPVAAFGYLALSGFHPEQMRASCDPGAPYAGGRTYAPDGAVTVTLAENDLYRLCTEEVDAAVAESLPAFISVKSWSAKLREGGLDAFIEGRLFNFIPVPLKVSADASFEKGTVTLKITEVRLGKLIPVPLDKLYAYGLPESIPITINEGGKNEKIQNIAFTEGGVAVTDKVIDTLLPGFFADARPLAETYTVYGLPLPDDSELIRTAADYMVSEVETAELCRMLAEADDPDATFLTLMALHVDKMTLGKLSVLEPFEREYIVPFTDEAIAAERARVLAPIANAQAEYEQLLTSVREKLKAGELTLDNAYPLDSATGEKLLLAPLSPALAIDDAACRVLLLHSLDALHAVATGDMPKLADVPKTSAKATGGAYDLIAYDVGILLQMPCGLYAILHYEAVGTFIINCIEKTMYEDLLGARLQPYLLSDTFPKPPTRALMDPPGDLVSPFDLLIPYEVTRAG